MRGLLFLLAAFSVAAQPVAIRVTVTLVQIDAVVTDAQGRHVPDLGPADFELRQDGEVQKVLRVVYVPAAHSPTAALAPKEVPIGPPAPITPAQVKRTVALVVDDTSLSFASLVRVRDSLRRFVQQQMQPGDLVAIVRTGGGVAILEQFTTDQRVLLAAIDLLKWRFNGPTGLLPIRPDGPPDPSASPSAPTLYGLSLSSLGALGTLQQVIRGMHSLPGRKSIVYLSDSLQLETRINDTLDRLTDMANRSAVSIYAIAPQGLKAGVYRNAESSEPPADSDGPFLPGMTESRGTSEFRSQEGLVWLARRTGGLFFTNNDIAGSIRQSVDDQLGYYLLAYTPREGTFEKSLAKAKFHRIALQVKRPGLRVRWKSGFTGVPDEIASNEPPPAATREQQLLDALASPFRANGLGVRLTSFYTDTGTAGACVKSLLQIDAKGIAFVRQSDGNWHARLDILTSAYRDIKQPIEQRQRSQEVVLSDEGHAKVWKQGLVYSIVDMVPRPGVFFLRTVVRDSGSERIGSASELVQVPDTRKRQLALSGIVVRLAPADVLPAGTPVDDLQPKEGAAEPWEEGGPAVRRYRPGQHLLYTFLVINPKSKGGKPPSVQYQIRLFRNGNQVYAGDTQTVPQSMQLDSRHLLGGGVLHFTSKFPPGEYLLQVLATDRMSKTRVAQWIDFEVLPLSAVALSALQ